MKNSFFFVISLFLAGSVTAQNFDVAVRNVTLINPEDGSGRPVNIYLTGGKIAELSPAVAAVKRAARTINGSGKFIMPGLQDMHVHFPSHHAERFFNLLTAAGITSCRVMKAPPEALAFKTTNADGNMPDLHIAYNIFPRDSFDITAIPGLVASWKSQGYELIKLFGLKDPAYFEAIMAAAALNKMIMCGHALSNVPAEKVISAGYRSIEHVGYFDRARPSRRDSLTALAAKNKTFICPTLDWSMMVYHSVPEDSLQFRAGYALGKKLYSNEWDTTYRAAAADLQDKKMNTYPAMMRTDVATKINVLRGFREQGITIIAGSDAEEPFQTPGYSLIEELKLIRNAGYNNIELLRMITLNADLFYGNDRALSGVRKDAPANFILLQKDPREDISNLETVEMVFHGRRIIDTKKLVEQIK